MSDLPLIIDKFAFIYKRWVKTIFTLCFGRINHHQLLNEYILHKISAFYETLIVKNN